MNANNFKRIIIIGIIFSFLYSFFVVFNFDRTNYSKYEIPYNNLIKGDSAHYFLKAEIFKENLDSNQALDLAGEYQASIFYPISLGFFYNFIDEKIFFDKKINQSKVINTKKKKILFLFFQISVFFYSVFFLIKKLNLEISSNFTQLAALFLIFEPSIFPYHSMFLTESFYLSFINFMLGYLVSPSLKLFDNFLFGFVIGLSYLLKTVSLLLIIPISIYLLFCFKKKFLLSFLAIIFGYSLVLGFLGYSNYQRSNLFYITPTQSLDAPYWYMSHIIDSKTKNISEEAAYKQKIKKEKKWIKENEINLLVESDRIKLAKYKQNYTNQIFKDNPQELFKYIFKKSFQFLIISPTWQFKYLKMNFVDKDYWKTNKNNFLLIIDIVYSLFIYLILLAGFFYSKKFLNKKFWFLLFFLCLYFFFLMSWTGVGRYNLPIICLSALYFSFGIRFIYENLIKKFVN